MGSVARIYYIKFNGFLVWMRLSAVDQCDTFGINQQCDTTLDNVLVEGIGRVVVVTAAAVAATAAAAAADVEAVGPDDVSSMGSGTMSLVDAATAVVAAAASAVVDVEGALVAGSSSTIFFIRTIKLRFDHGSV